MRAAALAMLLLAGQAGAAPHIVSLNPCVDAVLMRVADPAQIMAISHYSQDARATSVPLAWARRFRNTSGTAEEVVALQPDLVIASGHVAPATLAALTRLHVPVLQVGIPDTLADSRAQVIEVADAIGQHARGVALAAEIDAALAAAHPGKGALLPALIWEGGGLVPGAATLPDALLNATGFRNASADYGLQRWDVLPLEYLVARPPRVLLTVGGPDAGDRMLGHPVLRRLAGRIAVRNFPERLLRCGGPVVIEAATRLAAIRRGLGA